MGEEPQSNQQQARSRVSDDQLDGALSDKRYFMRQLKCALGEAPCDPVGRRLKSKFNSAPRARLYGIITGLGFARFKLDRRIGGTRDYWREWKSYTYRYIEL